MTDSKKYTSKLSGARVLIIGGSGGIGYCVAEALLECDASVIISSSQESRVKSSIETLLKSYPSAQGRISGHACDLSSPAMEENIETLFSQTGTVDHIICTAGDRLATLPIEEVTLESIQKAGMVRFFAPLLVAKYAPRYLSGGPVSSLTLTTGSVSEKPIAGWSVIASYVAGLHGMIRNLALDLAPIRVNLVSPGFVDTAFWDGSFNSKEDFEAFKNAQAQRSTTGEVGKPQDIAEAYMYLLRDWNCSGSVISTNSGALLTT